MENQPSRETQVQRALAGLEVAVGELGKAVESVMMRTDSVSRESTPLVGETVKEDEQWVPLASTIRDFTERIQDSSARLHDLANRIEL
jgi:hypothetical protein